MSFSRHRVSNSGLVRDSSSINCRTSSVAPARVMAARKGDHVPRSGLPIGLQRTHLGVAEEISQDVARLSIAVRLAQYQHGRLVPADDVPGRGAHESRAVFERIADVLQARRNAFHRASAPGKTRR